MKTTTYLRKNWVTRNTFQFLHNFCVLSILGSALQSPQTCSAKSNGWIFISFLLREYIRIQRLTTVLNSFVLCCSITRISRKFECRKYRRQNNYNIIQSQNQFLILLCPIPYDAFLGEVVPERTKSETKIPMQEFSEVVPERTEAIPSEPVMKAVPGATHPTESARQSLPVIDRKSRSILDVHAACHLLPSTSFHTILADFAVWP